MNKKHGTGQERFLFPELASNPLPTPPSPPATGETGTTSANGSIQTPASAAAPAEKPAGTNGHRTKGGAKASKSKSPKKPAAAAQPDGAGQLVTEALDGVAKGKGVQSSPDAEEAEANDSKSVAAMNDGTLAPFKLMSVEIFSAQDLNIQSYERMLAAMPQGENRAKVEIVWLTTLCAILNGGLRLLSVRKGFLLLDLKAAAAPNDYQRRAAELFPDTDARTLRYFAAQARLFEEAFGAGFNENGDRAYFENLKNTWTLTAIIAAAKSAGEKPSAACIEPEGDSPAKNATPVAKPKSSYVAIDTLRQHCRRCGKTSRSLLTSIKRLAEADVEKAAELISQHMPESVRPFYVNALAARKSALHAEDENCINI
jgi:hypothetical protein